MLKISCVAVATMLVLSGCGPSAEEQMIERLKTGSDFIEPALELVRDRFRDPSSVQIRRQKFVAAGRVLCGEANAKNGMGGYVGFAPFVVEPRDGVYGPPGCALLKDDAAFTSVFEKYCL